MTLKRYASEITSPGEAFNYFRPLLIAEVEEFWAAALNSEKKVISSACLFRGTVDCCFFHPRDVFRFACLHNASSILVAHNHPSGNAEPSNEDQAITNQLIEGGQILGVPVVDHIILAGDKFFSFLRAGMMTAKPSFNKRRITDAFAAERITP